MLCSIAPATILGDALGTMAHGAGKAFLLALSWGRFCYLAKGFTMENIYTGICITPDQNTKLQQMANALGSSRNRVIRLLIDSAELVEVTKPSVAIKTNGAGAMSKAGAIQ